MKSVVIASLVVLLNFLALAQIPSDTNLRFYITNLLASEVSGIVSNTQADVLYEFQYKQNRTNWVSWGFSNGSEITNCMSFYFLTNRFIPTTKLITNLINTKSIRIRSWIDSCGVGIPDWWQLKNFGDVGIDAYGNPMNDGWNNMQKFRNGMNPFRWYPPPPPESSVSFHVGTNGGRFGSAIVTWKTLYGTIPDYFLIERANRTMRPMTNNFHFTTQSPYGINGKSITNRPPNFRPPFGRPDLLRQNPLITGPFEIVARIPGQEGVRDYHYVETNADTLFQPAYRVQAHYSTIPLYAQLNEITTESIRKTILPVTVRQTTNGYGLTVLHPVPYDRYLLLVRDKIDKEWRASGYFVSGTNRNPVDLHVDKKGMMTDTQSPITLPAVKFLPDVVRPEFTAGWGEDSDGDGLPDIYEVLVTHTKPDETDTGDTGIPDGYKIFADDGWNNWEKFRCRANPFLKCDPPPAIVLIKPSASEMIEAQTPKTDLPFELYLEIRTNSTANFKPVSLDGIFIPDRNNAHAPYDVRVSWKVPPPTP